MAKVNKGHLVKTIVTTTIGLVSNEKIQKTILGVYSDGTPRSLADCISGEIISPKDKGRILNRKKNKNKKKNKKKSKMKINIDDF